MAFIFSTFSASSRASSSAWFLALSASSAALRAASSATRFCSASSASACNLASSSFFRSFSLFRSSFLLFLASARSNSFCLRQASSFSICIALRLMRSSMSTNMSSSSLSILGGSEIGSSSESSSDDLIHSSPRDFPRSIGGGGVGVAALGASSSSLSLMNSSDSISSASKLRSAADAPFTIWKLSHSSPAKNASSSCALLDSSSTALIRAAGHRR
mmetsp:Transcript_14181/g.25295  ORF Transcript_14181/g.25295 Transcript_14181/m.25295 type:complete len:216 (-) Transcript_14181:2570-3217(-)